MIDLWGNASDPLLQALHFIATVGCMLCVQISKQFLARRDQITLISLPKVNGSAVESNTKSTDFPTPTDQNFTRTPNNFGSDIQNVFFIVGACCFIGSVMLLASWIFYDCKLSHFEKDTEEETQNQSSGSKSNSHGRGKIYLFFASFILCLTSFLAFANEENFSAFGITFAVNSLSWATGDGSNLVTVFWASTLVCRCVSIVFAKFVKVNKFMIVSTLIGLMGTALMASMVEIIPISLWIGACLLGLGNSNTVGNALNAGKRLTSQTGIISSFISASSFTGKIVAPFLLGQLFDLVDPMWFLYLGVVYSSGMFLLSITFLFVQLCNGKQETMEPESDIALEKMSPKA